MHRYGGWYSDLDMVFLRPIKESKDGNPLHNVAASDGVHFSSYDNTSEKHNWGPSISNAIFHNDAGHIFLETAIRLFNSTFINGQWASSGPDVLTKALEEICGQKKKPLNPFDYSRSHCSGITVAEPRLFYPVDWSNAGLLPNKNSDSFWNELFSKSYVVHFYGTSSQYYGIQAMGMSVDNNPEVLQPKHYGNEMPALAYLGPTECPLSFFSTMPF